MEGRRRRPSRPAERLASMGGRYLGRKLAQAFVTIVAIVLLNFVLFRLMPGSPERVLFRNPNLSPAVVAAARVRWGLDKPLIPDQLVAYVESTMTGDLGYSFKFRGQAVTDVIADRVGPTVLLVGLGELVSIIVGLALGVVRRLAPRRPARSGRQRDQPDPLLDAVFRHRHAADHHLRGRPGLVPDLGHAIGGRRRRAVPRSSSSTSAATSPCPWRRCRSGSSAATRS